jgi:hypothetical protein
MGLQIVSAAKAYLTEAQWLNVEIVTYVPGRSTDAE